MKTSDGLLSAPTAFHGIGAFFYTELWVQLHERLAMFTAMVVQAVILVFVAILNPSLLGVALLGAILFSAFGLGQRVQNEAAYVRIDHKLNELYLASPLQPEAYFLGMSLGILVAYLPPFAVLVALSFYFIHMTWFSSVLLLLLSLTVAIFACSVGYAFSTLFRDNRAIWPYASIFYNLFGVLPPVFYPLAFFPAKLQPVALLMPPSAAAALMQWATGSTALTSGQIELAVLGLIAETSIVFVFAIYWSRRCSRVS
jgi:ABC-2 type transport system permease protein